MMATNPDPHDLGRFVSAQDRVWTTVAEELRLGRKRSHWMWFVFPQIAGLGQSAISKRYAISSLEEAVAYDRHPILGARLRDAARRVLDANAQAIEDILPPPDDLKLMSSMTLFDHAASDTDVYSAVLNRFFDGQACQPTQDRLTIMREKSAD